jgi:hypothetical protein
MISFPYGNFETVKTMMSQKINTIEENTSLYIFNDYAKKSTYYHSPTISLNLEESF